MARKNGPNFAKFHTRGGRGLQRAHPGIGYPLPPAQGLCGGGRVGTRAATPCGRATRRRGHTPGGAATRRQAATTGRGADYPAARLPPGHYGAHGARRLPGRAFPRRRDYRGKRGGCSPNVGGYRARATTGARWATCAGLYGAGLYRGRRGGTPPGGAGGYPAARGRTSPAATPAGYPGRRRATVQLGV